MDARWFPQNKARFLDEGMTCMLSIHDDVPIALELPRTVTFEIVETEPAVKNRFRDVDELIRKPAKK